VNPERRHRLQLSGERFRCTYHLHGTGAEAAQTAADICVEQTIEYPQDLVHDPDIREQIFGCVESLRPIDAGLHEAVIAFPVEVAGVELTQLLNVAFGNISLKPWIRLVNLELGCGVLSAFRGPRFGVAGLRRRIGVERPLLASALKPMGLDEAAFASLARRYALGGLDLVKDDHGLANQPFARYASRVERCAEAVREASRETGAVCLYAPNVTAPADRIVARARHAKAAGAGALLVAPGLCGFDAMRQLADDDTLGLPILAHPAFLGAFVVSPGHGISHGTLFGLLMRLAGADVTIFPSYGGRFSFSIFDCREIVVASRAPLGSLAPIFPAPAGGMRLPNVPAMREVYGRDTLFLVGGDLHRGEGDVVARCREFVALTSADPGV